MSEENIQQTPLAELHLELGAKMIPFAGRNMPVQYTSIMDEHSAVRNAVGVFDISHMGQFLLSGEGAEAWLNTMLTNDVENLEVDDAQYTLMLNENGGVIDDLIIYRIAVGQVFMVVNASMIAEDFRWLTLHLEDGLTLSNESEDWAGMAVQGPDAADVYGALFSERILPRRNGIDRWEQFGEEIIVCRTGYTGEDGFELFVPASAAIRFFQKCIDAGAKPCGLGARDSLRTEVCYPLNGADLSPERTPIEAGLGFFCALETDFIGVEKLRAQKAEGLNEKLVALKYTGKGAPPRAHYEVFSKADERIGELSSGVLSPSLREGVAMAYLPVEHASLGTLVDVDVRGRRFEAEVVKKPFYKKG
ncbi:glycine cleavage system aminomethyltransferase GcvT [Rubritalea spongiae]|uniref:Aminomethyltransferase n=1 Tax=Rubritalea spongiae TaxID=430797 RepID=A0ABW5DXD6_9BACT